MGHLRSISVLALALGTAASGCAIMFDDPDDTTEPPAPPPAPPLETSRFVPALCTGATPGAPQCPINHVDLGDLGATGAFDFVLQAVGGGLYFNRLELAAGSEGLYLEHPTLRAWSGNSPSSEVPFDVILNIPPGASETLGGGTAVFINTAGVSALSLRFAAIGPFRPE